MVIQLCLFMNIKNTALRGGKEKKDIKVKNRGFTCVLVYTLTVTNALSMHDVIFNLKKKWCYYSLLV